MPQAEFISAEEVQISKGSRESWRLYRERDLPWSMWAMMLKFLMFSCFTILLPLSAAGSGGGGGHQRGPSGCLFLYLSGRRAYPAPGAHDWGLPGPGPRGFASGGVLFPRRKSTQKGAGDTPAPPFFCLIGRLQGRTAQPLNHRILRASDLRRASRPASAVALLKG